MPIDTLDRRRDEAATPPKPPSKADEELLKELREDYRYCLDYWREIREEAATDMRYVAGDPWDDDERDEREDNGRPCISLDELGQYLNQAINNLRQNKRAIKVKPKGKGATDKDAEKRAGIIRGFEYESNAQAARTTSFEGAINCGMGFRRIVTVPAGTDSEFDMQPRIKRIPNSQTVLLDPNAKEADFSDGELAFVTDTIRAAEFGRRFPTAQKKSFSTDDQNDAKDFFQGENLVIAEYWRVEKTKRKKLQVRFAGGITTVFEDEIPEGTKYETLNERTIETRKVMQYITNGVEILERNEWDGSWIPIIGVFGKEIYVRQSGISKRVFMSLVRLARAPQMLYAYYCSQQAEEAGMAPRAPILLWEGQEQADEEALKYLNKIPRAYVRLRLITDPTTGAVVPPPERHPFVPNFEGYEVVKESIRRAIQSAMGIMPLPSQAQRRNEKSGIALEKIQTQEQVGSYHFTDNYNQSLEYEGRQLNELITIIMDTRRHVGVRNPDDTHDLMQVMSQEQFDALLASGQIQEDDDYLISDRGEFDVTISTGPSFQSEREEASDFVDTIIQNIQALPVPPQAKATLLAKAVKLKNIGPIGDEIAKILDPQGDGEPIPPQAQAMISELQQKAQALDAFAQDQHAQVQKLEQEKQAKIVDNEYKAKEADKDRVVKVTLTEITTKAQIESERMKWEHEAWKLTHQSAHDVGMQAVEHGHQADQAEAAQAAAAEQAQQAPDNGAQPAA